MEIKSPVLADFAEINRLFVETIEDNFRKEGIYESHQSDLHGEIKAQTETLAQYFKNEGKDGNYLVAKINDRIVGTIAYGKPNEIIANHLGLTNFSIPEIKSVYVLPEYQRIGVGFSLLTKIQEVLLSKGIREFYLDCGYRRAQTYWKKRLGEPILVLENYWGLGVGHLIWKGEIKSRKYVN